MMEEKRTGSFLFKAAVVSGSGTLLFGIVILIIIMAFVMAVAEAINKKNAEDPQNLWNDKVLSYESMITNYCSDNGITKYKYHLMAIMQLSTGGEGKDPMAASDFESNTTGKTITNAETSIKIGVLEFKKLLSVTGVTDPEDADKLLIVYQAYHLGRGYISFLKQRPHSQKLALQYINEHDVYDKTSYFADNVAILVDRAKILRQNMDLMDGGDDSVFIWPLDPGYTYISSGFGYRICPFHGKEYHGGIDIPAAMGDPIYATKSGTVTTARYDSSFGNYITIDHGNGYTSQYCHSSQLLVTVGDSVVQGQTIAYVGSTGSSTGPHLDFRMITAQGYQNPLNFVSPEVNITNMPRNSVEEGLLAGYPIEQIVYNYLIGLGYNDIQTSAVMGNIWAESGFDPALVEYGNGIGYGLCQWSFDRRTALENYAKSKGKPASDLQIQLEFLKSELVPSMFIPQSRYYTWLNGDINEATKAFMLGWERPYSNDPTARQRMALYYYNKYRGE